jgi:hypothetical protein
VAVMEVHSRAGVGAPGLWEVSLCLRTAAPGSHFILRLVLVPAGALPPPKCNPVPLHATHTPEQGVTMTHSGSLSCPSPWTQFPSLLWLSLW